MNRLWLPGLVCTLWTDGSGRHSSKPHFGRCGVVYYTDTGESVRLSLRSLSSLSIERNFWFLSERLKHASRLCWLVIAKGLSAFLAGVQIVWMRAHQSDKDAEEGRVLLSDLQGNRKVDTAGVG
eukprot:3893265-Amphidinium_carterae.1